MARTKIPVDVVYPNTPTTGTNTPADAANDMYVNAGGDLLINFVNTNSSTKTATIIGVNNRGIKVDQTMTIPASGMKIIKVDNEFYRQTDGTIHVDFATGEDTDVTVTAIRLMP